MTIATPPPKASVPEMFLNFIRGGLIALAELVPGISGGTIALIVGLYERALAAGNQMIKSTIGVVKREEGAAKGFAKLDWAMLIPVAIGMFATIFSMAGVMHDFVEGHPEVSRGLFLGMVAASVYVPIKMIGTANFAKRAPLLLGVMLLGAILTFWGTGFTAAPQQNPSLLIIFVAAAIAVCALVLPGVSGSFFLLAVGLYSPVMAAIDNRDLAVIAVFGLGAVTGLALFVRGLSFALEEHREITLALMSGLMIGSLRALWPWQDMEANLLAPGDNMIKIVGFIVLGFVIVGATILADIQLAKKYQTAANPPQESLGSTSE